MNAMFRHLAARLWVTALTGGLLGLAVLPWLQGGLDLQWLPMAAIVLLGGCFMAAGQLMNFAGMRFLRRQIKEAGVWEQAGMTTEAETSYNQVMGQFDSFWLTPLRRRSQAIWVAGKLARFYLSHSTQTAHARHWLAAYLKRFPQDEAVAEIWMEQLLLFDTHSPEEQDTASLVGRTLRRKRRIQQLLMKFYLSCGRTDFDALQTYRIVWKEDLSMTESVVRRLSRLLIEAALLNHWAFQVYVKAGQAGESAVLAGIAAGLRWLPPDPGYKADFAVAKTLIEDQDQSRLEKQILRFKPAEIGARAVRRKLSPRQYRPRLASFANRATEKISETARGLAAAMGHWVMQPRRWVIIMVPVAALLLWVVGRPFFDRPPVELPPTVKVEKAPVITDPFTIQVAAYLKSEDAQRFVDQLVQKGLDAFWTNAVSANRSWYQVKVSHFISKEAARAYGGDLKSRGLIDDFYVANYDRAAPPPPKPSTP